MLSAAEFTGEKSMKQIQNNKNVKRNVKQKVTQNIMKHSAVTGQHQCKVFSEENIGDWMYTNHTPVFKITYNV